MIEKIPKVTTLAYIAPSSRSARDEVLQYDKVEETVAGHRPFEYPRMRETFVAEPGSFEEAEAARQQAFQYMLFTVDALQKATTPEKRELWSDRYTQATSELYGVPDPTIAVQLFEQQQRGEVDQPFAEVAHMARGYLETTYGAVYAALDLDNAPDKIPIESVADRFDVALETLTQHDDAWAEWTIKRDNAKAQMSISAKSKTVNIGMQGVSMTPERLKGLFSHEVLVHALRAVGDQKAGGSFENGLPGYLDADEGLGVFAEYAITGHVPVKIIDRYVDIAYALGQIDGRKHTRQEMLDLALNRAMKRNDEAEQPSGAEDVLKSVYNHVNRIYRGSRGDDHIGIYTKDIAYYVGFRKIGAYITEQVNDGKSIDDVMAYLLAGRFDPTLESHQEHMANRSE